MLQTTSLDVLKTMADVVALFSNVIDYVIEWANEPAAPDLLPFLRAAWKTFGPNLHTLSLAVPLHKFEVLRLSYVDLRAIRELSITIPHTEDFGAIEPGPVLCGAVSSLIERLSPRLRSFSFTSRKTNSNLSPLFSSLPSFPMLDRLNVTLPLVLPVPLYTSPIIRILRDHDHTIQHVNLMVNNLVQGHDQEWSSSMISEPAILSNLRTLQLYMAMDTKTALELTRRSCNTLTTLDLWGKYMSYDEAYTLVNLFSHRPASRRLDSFGISVSVLSPQILDVLASALPELQNLRLAFHELAFTNGTLQHPVSSTLVVIFPRFDIQQSNILTEIFRGGDAETYLQALEAHRSSINSSAERLLRRHLEVRV
jgi:hypothetical protein